MAAAVNAKQTNVETQLRSKLTTCKLNRMEYNQLGYITKHYIPITISLSYSLRTPRTKVPGNQKKKESDFLIQKIETSPQCIES